MDSVPRSKAWIKKNNKKAMRVVERAIGASK